MHFHRILPLVGAVAVLSVSAALLTHAHADPTDPAELLKSKDVVDRLEAVQALKQNGGEDAEKLLIDALKDKDWEVAEWAAEGLGEQGGEDSVKPLVAVALKGQVRRMRLAAARSLAKVGITEAAAQLHKKTGAKNEELGIAASDALAVLAITDGERPEEAMEFIRKGVERALQTGEPAVRVAAARGLPAFRPADAAALLTKLLYDDNIGVAAAALDGVRARPHLAYLEPLLVGLRKDDLKDVIERRVQAAIQDVIALHEPGDAAQAAAEPIVEALGQAGGALEAARLSRCLGLLAETEPALPEGEEGPEPRPPLLASKWALEKLERGLRHDEELARASAARALGRIGTDDALARAGAAAKADPSPRVRLHALRAVVFRRPAPDQDTVNLASDRLQYDDDARVREAAAVGLGAKGADAVSVLEKALKDKDWSVAVCAAVSLGKTRSPDGLAALVRVADEAKEWKLRGAAVVGLGRMQNVQAVPHLIHALDDKANAIRQTAFEFLRRMTLAEINPTSKAWTEWWEGEKDGYTFVDHEEEARKAAKFGYAPDTRGVYEGQDIVVLQSRGDTIEKLLARLEIEFRLTRAGQMTDTSYLHPFAVFVSNCTGEINAKDVDQLSWFVRVGGYLFCSCWALDHTAEIVYPGVVGKLKMTQEVLDNVVAEACPTESPYLEGVFDGVTQPIYVLYGSHLIYMHDPERVEVLIDSPDCATRWGGGNLACWFDAGHGVILDSANHFDLQGLEKANGVKGADGRRAYAMDHMGLGHEELRLLDAQRVWKSGSKANKAAKDLSAFRFITNFVRQKRRTDP